MRMLLDKTTLTWGPFLFKRSAVHGFSYDASTQKFSVHLRSEQRVELGHQDKSWDLDGLIPLRVDNLMLLSEHLLGVSEEHPASDTVSVWTTMGEFEIPREIKQTAAAMSVAESDRPSPAADWVASFKQGSSA